LRRRVAIVQSSYVPWKGYFDLIRACDEFILLDDAQFTRRDWRNRNRIKTKDGTRWITIPVRVRGRYLQSIEETEVADPGWADSHWRLIEASYRKAPCFARFRDPIRAAYENPSRRLSEVNHRLIVAICGQLGIRTPITFSAAYRPEGRRSARLVDLCRKAGATSYLSGPSARAYLELRRFEEAGIAVEFADYSDYPEYPQLHGPFDHFVSVLDLIFNVGAGALGYMKEL
jgi:hypothetical protein